MALCVPDLQKLYLSLDVRSGLLTFTVFQATPCASCRALLDPLTFQSRA